MPNLHEPLRTYSGRRCVLVVDDELVNREILRNYLCNDYEVLCAADGMEALRLMRERKDSLSLVLLDLLMPVMSGYEVLKSAKADEELKHIPVIVTTSEQAAELESLQLGAIDFVPKPYPPVDIVLARVLRIIELSEDRDIIQSTERDALTGLLNKEFFYRYAEQFDQRHPDMKTDAVILDVNHFHMINERYGKAYGDEVLRRIGQKAREMVGDSGGIVCRREADTFMVYCPHREDYKDIMEHVSTGLFEDDRNASNRVRLRMGIYSDVDKGIDIERRFDRAKMASDSVRGNFTKAIGLYDSHLHEKNLFAEQLIEDFSKALEEHQFHVYYQPKFDIRPNTPVLAGAEALVRWIHPEHGMISPGIFIPLFEENGLIQQLDSYVWRETARQVRAWKDKFDYSIPISVNVSRVDMFDQELPAVLEDILTENRITSEDLHLEVTESAYTQDSVQIITAVERFRSLGFKVEMDDFGSGYSSLNMVSSLPIDALKLDMQFIRNAFKPGGSTHMIEIIINIADYLHVPVIAEGVETEDQLTTLKDMGCDIVQGYFFSKPVPASEFEAFILQKKESDRAQYAGAEVESADQIILSVREAETSEAVAEEAAKEAQKDAGKRERSGIHLRTANLFFAVLAILAAVSLFISDIAVAKGYQRVENACDRYIAAQLAASDMESASDYLTDRVRCFVVTGEVQYLKDFFEEVNVTRRRDLAVENLEELLAGSDNTALMSLNSALLLSNELINTEYLAMRMMVEIGDYDPADLPEEITSITLSSDIRQLSDDELRHKAQDLVFDSNYMHFKDRIRENVGLCTQSLIRSSSLELENASSRMTVLVNLQTVLTILFLLIVFAVIYFISTLIRKPLTKMVDLMRTQETIPPTGAEELRFVTRTYNYILEENRIARERLSHEASHDSLTGLFNRGAYDMLMKSVDVSHIALILIDIDLFKSINDTYGHAVGDRVLRRVAEVLQQSFRSVDIICRFGGDEFVIVMTRVTGSMGQLVMNKIARVNEILSNPKDNLPPVTLSAGVAFSDRAKPQGDIFNDADTALYRVKKSGRGGCSIY